MYEFICLQPVVSVLLIRKVITTHKICKNIAIVIYNVHTREDRLRNTLIGAITGCI